MAMTNAEKQARQRDREKQRGIIRKIVRIPAGRSDDLDAIVAEWVALHDRNDEEH